MSKREAIQQLTYILHNQIRSNNSNFNNNVRLEHVGKMIIKKKFHCYNIVAKWHVELDQVHGRYIVT